MAAQTSARTPHADLCGAAWGVAHHPSRTELWIPTGRAVWVLSVPSETSPAGDVRLHLREMSSRRGAEASALLGAAEHRQALEWLRCLPEGPCPAGDVPPALALLAQAFEPLTGALRSLVRLSPT